MRKKRTFTTSYDDLIDQHYSRHSEPIATNTVKMNDLLANYYGKPLPNPNAGPKPAASMSLSLSMDNGELLAQPGAARGPFEEYVVPQSLDGAPFDEYVVYNQDYAAPSSFGPLLARPYNASQEYALDIFQEVLNTPNPADVPSRNDAPTAAGPASAQNPVAGGTSAQSAGSPNAQPAAAAPTAPVLTNPTQAGQDTAPTSGAGDNQPGQPPAAGAKADEEDFLADLQAILTGQKVYDPSAGKTVDRSSKPVAPNNTSAPPVPDARSEHAIFDRIAQSMEYATAYDLGTVELNNRFSSFDKVMDQQSQAAGPKHAAQPRATQASVNTADFLADLQTMRPQQFKPLKADDSSDSGDDSEAFSLPAVSHAMFDTGEHVLMGNDLYIDALHVGQSPGVAFSYGDIISLPDLYETVDQLNSTSAAELQAVKQLVQKSTAFYKGGKANRALDVSNKQWNDATGGRYLNLAEENYTHFSPNLLHQMDNWTASMAAARNHRTEWEKYHKRAIQEAQKMLLAHGNAPSTLFLEWPLTINAFADHFLTDAFAAGHQINKDELIALFKSKFINGSDLTKDAETFFKKVANLAWKGDLKTRFSSLESVETKYWVFHLDTDSASNFATLLMKIMEKEPEKVANLAAKALHDDLNEHGLEVTNLAGDRAWTLTGDAFAYKSPANLAVIRKAVTQSIANINDPSIAASNLDYNAYFNKVWQYTPVLTSASHGKMLKMMDEYTDPTSSKLQAAAADILGNQVNVMVAELKHRHIMQEKSLIKRAKDLADEKKQGK